MLLGAIEALYATRGTRDGGWPSSTALARRPAANHHPGIALAYPTVHVRCSPRFRRSGRARIALAARSATSPPTVGIDATPEQLSRIEVGLGGARLDHSAVGAFWAAVLGFDLDEDDIADPRAGG